MSLYQTVIRSRFLFTIAWAIFAGAFLGALLFVHISFPEWHASTDSFRLFATFPAVAALMACGWWLCLPERRVGRHRASAV